MDMQEYSKNLFIIAGCNGAGKTTASFALLPDKLSCREYVNADEIAKGLSPFQVEKVAIEAGRIMLNRIQTLLHNQESFAIETTLSTKSYKTMMIKAQEQGYQITLVFFWLNSVELAKERVKKRVLEGGHHIPEEVIERRYLRGIQNLFNIYLPISDKVYIFDNSNGKKLLIAEKNFEASLIIHDREKFSLMMGQMKDNHNSVSEQETQYERSTIAEAEMDELKAKILEGLDLAYQKLVEKTRKNGGTLVVERDGKIVHIKP